MATWLVDSHGVCIIVHLERQPEAVSHGAAWQYFCKAYSGVTVTRDNWLSFLPSGLESQGGLRTQRRRDI